MIDIELVSVVVPAYNAEMFIDEAVRSVLIQTYTELELIVVDDGSTDHTIKKVRGAADPRVRVISQPNAGVSSARNRGIQASSGAYVAFLDSDDTWLPHKLATQVAALAREPSWGAVGSLVHYISPSGRVLGVGGYPIGKAERAVVAGAQFMPFAVSSLLIRRTTLCEVGLFDESLQHDIPGQVEDLDFLARVASAAELGCVPEVLGGYRVHGASATARHYRSQSRGGRYLAARTAARKENRELTYAEFNSRPESLRLWRLDTAGYCYRAAGLAVANRQLVAGAFYALAALLLHPARFVHRLQHQRGALFRASRPPAPKRRR